MLPNNMDSGTWERPRVAGGMSRSSWVRRLNDIHFLTSPSYYSLVLGNSTGVWASVFVSVKSRRCKPPTYTLLGVVLRIKWGNRHSKVGNSEALCKYHEVCEQGMTRGRAEGGGEKYLTWKPEKVTVSGLLGAFCLFSLSLKSGQVIRKPNLHSWPSHQLNDSSKQLIANGWLTRFLVPTLWDFFLVK